MSSEIKVNLAEMENVINLMKDLETQTGDITVGREIYQDYLLQNVGRAKDKMNACEYKTNSIRSRLTFLVNQTNIFLQNTKNKMEEDDAYLSNQIDTLTK